ncbi:hypothetical protein, partial [Erwinia rhapontici]|uniref:hypothetical protein n=1 Tax=Erwinia rhapontici TaxID=55212 RepID=UPI003BA0C173
ETLNPVVIRRHNTCIAGYVDFNDKGGGKKESGQGEGKMKKPASTAPCQITGSNVRPGSVSGLFAQLVPVTEADMPFQCEKKSRLHTVLLG